jgi:hypothetical protein
VLPAIVPGVAGGFVTVIGRQREELVPQIFVAVTQTSPLAVPIVTVIALVELPPVIVAPLGSVQL